MSVSPSADRLNLLAECLPLLEELRKLNAERFEQSAFIAGAIDEYESGLRTLAGLGDGRITEDRRDGTGDCPVCGTAITHMPRYGIVLCGQCDELYMPAHSALCGDDGFRTDSI